MRLDFCVQGIQQIDLHMRIGEGLRQLDSHNDLRKNSLQIDHQQTGPDFLDIEGENFRRKNKCFFSKQTLV